MTTNPQTATGGKDQAVRLTVDVAPPVAAWLRAVALRLGSPDGPGQAAADLILAAYARAQVSAAGLAGGATWTDAERAARRRLNAEEAARIRAGLGDPLAAPAGWRPAARQPVR